MSNNRNNRPAPRSSSSRNSSPSRSRSSSSSPRRSAPPPSRTRSSAPPPRRGNRRPVQPRRRRRYSSRRPTPLSMLIVAVMLVGLAFLFFQIKGSAAGASSSSTASSTSSTALSASSDTLSDVDTDTAAPEATADPAIATAQAMLDDPLMILVSAANPMPDDYTVETKVADTDTGKELSLEAADAFIAMKAAAAADGVTIFLQSAYRSVAYQQNLFDAQIAKWMLQGYDEDEATIQAATVVAIPGCSEHNCGLAADINCPDFYALEEGFEDTTAFAWLVENAQDYGYILRYPKDDEDTTGIIYEPWHWRYVGVDNAIAIKESGLCLEDFLDGLQAIVDAA